jgi:hypothetical protein
MWIHESTLTTKSETATRSKNTGGAGLSTDSVSGLFNLRVGTAKHTANGIIIYVCKVREST